jgi:hypothetical protein
MIEDIWLRLNLREKALLLDALFASRAAGQAGSDEIDALILKLVQAQTYPQITVAVQGGLVQRVLGSPVPIRICDYDTEGDESPGIDERGQPCRIWFEPADTGIEKLS